MIVFLTVINVILAVVIITMVLLQQGKGSDLGSAFGGGSSNSMFGAVVHSNFLGKLTAIVAALFLVLNLAQAVLLKNANTEVLFTDEEIQEAEMVEKKSKKKK